MHHVSVTRRIALVPALFLLLLVVDPAAGAQKKALVIGIDGARADCVLLANAANLHRLRSEGAWSFRAQCGSHTKSGPSWSSMFCGVWDDKTAVIDNNLAPANYATYPDFFTRLERANSNLFTISLGRWEVANLITLGADIRYTGGSDTANVTNAIARLTNSNPDVMFIHFLHVDDTGHASGFHPSVSNYLRAIETVDALIGQVLRALTNRLNYAAEDWLILVVADHGGLLDKTHGADTPEERTIFYIAHGPSAARGELLPVPALVDVCATVLTHVGVPINPAWSLDARVAGLPRPPPRYGTNLVFNGDAEFASGTNNYAPNRGIAWWTDLSGMTAVRYGAQPQFPQPGDAGPTNRGLNFFCGGTNLGVVRMSQIIDLSALAADIDSGEVSYDLRGWFGGTGTQNDQAELAVRFLTEAEAQIATNRIGAVTAADRSGYTSLLERKATGRLPAGTRRAEFIFTATAQTGLNDGYADNLSFVLTPPPDPAVVLLDGRFVSDQWRVEFASLEGRLYSLERTQDFESWTTVTSGTPGTGAVLTLDDPAPLSGRAFYRVRAQRP